MLFKPNIWIKNVLEIDARFLYKRRIKGLILDLDNTLSMHGSPAAEEGVFEWLESMRKSNIRMIVASNNTEKRVAPLAAKLGLEYYSFSCKPLPFGLIRAAKKLGLPRKRVAVVGDQIFTDIMGGNLAGMTTVLVEPFRLETNAGFRFKRWCESLLFHRDYSRLKGKG